MNTKVGLHKQPYGRLPLFLSFALPFVIACIAYAVIGLYPFGNRQLLAHDQWHQYYPYFASFREKLLNGASLQYTWDVGMGTGYASLFAYYLASPLNLLCVLIPSAYLREYFALMTVLKFSFAGLFFGVFLRTAFRKNDLSIPFFALMYAFCAWAGGYAWNIIWLDSFALVPLLIAGTVSLLRDGRFRMYVIALALTLWSNYYIAYFCCIFVLICFIGYCIIRWAGFKNLLHRFLRIGLCTLLGFGIAAVLLIPTMLAMQTTYSAAGNEFHFLALNVISGANGTIPEGSSLWELLKTQTLPGLLEGTRQVINNLLPGRELTSFNQELPNLYCSFTAVMLMIYGFFTKKISLREKLFNLFLLLFFLLSFLIRGLDYIWHGFHFPNMLYFRFSFLFSFVVIAAAYRSFTQLDHIKKPYLIVLLPLSAAFLVNYIFAVEEILLIVLIPTAAVILFVFTVLLLYRKTAAGRRAATFSLGIVICFEMVLCFSLSVQQVGSTSRDAYPKEGPYVQALINYAEKQEAAEGNLFWRMEMTTTQTFNDPALNAYNGVSIFTSSANVNFNRFSHSLGLSAWPGSNRYAYYETMPFSNTMLGVKYLISRDGKHLNTDYNLLLASSGDVKLLENTSYISTGFMTDIALADFVSEYTSNAQTDPIGDQNEMFRLATALQEPLYSVIDADEFYSSEGSYMDKTGRDKYSFSTKELSEDGTFTVCYTAPYDGLYCGTSGKATGLTEVKIYVNDTFVCSYNVKARSLFTIGSLNQGDTVRLEYKIDAGNSGSFDLSVARMDHEVLNEGIARLADEAWKITEFSDTQIGGTIQVKQDGLFYTSIPYEPGWTVYVDSVEVSIAEGYDPSSNEVAITDAVICFPLSEGSHEILLRYETPGLLPGLLISAVCLLIFLAMLVLLRKKPVLFADAESERQYHYDPAEEESSAPTEPEPEIQELRLEDILLEHAVMQAEEDRIATESEEDPEHP